jgi:hypothetical protein
MVNRSAADFMRTMQIGHVWSMSTVIGLRNGGWGVPQDSHIASKSGGLTQHTTPELPTTTQADYEDATKTK